MGILRLLKRELSHDIEQWVQEELITEAQASKICARYDIVYGEYSGKSRAYSILMSLGLLFLGLSVLTVLGANWEEIPRSLRVVGLFGATLASNAVALKVYWSGKTKVNLAVGFFLLGGLLYGASIMLIGQMYHLGVHYVDGVLWWALGMFPIALLMKSNTLMLVASALAFVWAIVSIEIGYFPMLGFVFLAGIAFHLYCTKPNLVLFLGLIGGACLYLQFGITAFIGDGQELRLGAENVLIGFALILVLYSTSAWLLAQNPGAFKDYGVLLDIWLLRLVIVTLFVFSFKEPWRELMEAVWETPGITLVVIGLLGLLAIGIALSQLRQSSVLTDGERQPLVPTLVGVVALMGLSATVILFPEDSLILILQIMTNLLTLGVGVYLVSKGLAHRITYYFFTGVATILLLAVVRYFDLIGDYIGASILFGVCAIVLIGVAGYWKRSQSPMAAKS